MNERQLARWARTRERGQRPFVLIGALIWFAFFGLLPLSFFLAHAVAPVLLGIVFVAGLLVADIAWHLLECAHIERAGGAGAALLARRRRTLAWFLAVPCVTPLLSVLIVVLRPGYEGILLSIVVAFAALSGALFAFERSMESIG